MLYPSEHQPKRGRVPPLKMEKTVSPYRNRSRAGFWAAGLATALLCPPAAASPDGAPNAPANAVFFELGGPGGLYSVGYERTFGQPWSIRAAVSGLRFTVDNTDIQGAFFPVTGHYLLGRGSHRWEVGFGVTIGALWSERTTYLLTVPVLIGGYRYQPQDQPWQFRIGLTPVLGGRAFAPLGLPVQPWGAVALGYIF